MKKIITTYFLLLLFNISYAEIPHDKNISSQQTVSSNQSIEILSYLNKRLEDAGFSKETQKYILHIAEKRILANGNLQKLDKKLIDENIYMLIDCLKLKNHKSSVLVREQIYRASQYKNPWEYLLKNEQLEFFSSHLVFGNLSLLEVQDALSKLCPIWPFCKSPIKPQKKNQEKQIVN